MADVFALCLTQTDCVNTALVKTSGLFQCLWTAATEQISMQALKQSERKCTFKSRVLFDPSQSY